MRAIVLFLAVALVGCVKSVSVEQPPTTSRTVTKVTRNSLTEVRVYGQVISVEIIEGPVHTWMTPEDVEKMIEERHRRAREQGLECWPGDPLCPDLP